MAGHGVDRNATADGSGASVTPVEKGMFTAKGDLAAGTANAAVDNLAVGANETRLVADSTQATGLKYVADTVNYAVAAKGDLLTGTAADTVAPLTVGANNTILVADSAQAGGMKWEALAATDAIPGLVEIATQAEQETGTDTGRAVTPGRQHFHPSAAKAWVEFNSAGTIAASYNVSTITDSGVGDWTVNLATDMSGGAYVGVVFGGTTNPGTLRAAVYNIASDPAAGTFQISCYDGIDGVTLRDPNINNILAVFFGDQ